MRRLFPLLFFCSLALPVHAWNAAGHRLVAVIAWQQLSPTSQAGITHALAQHPDYPRWVNKARSADDGAAIWAEAATWPDDIRNDPRFYDENAGEPTPPLPGLTDTARHKDWHYVDLDAAGHAQDGQIEQQIDRLQQVLRSTQKIEQIAQALPWLAHLVADIHQPLHVGRQGDAGGNAVEIENPFNKRLPFSSLHLYWDDLPGPPWLRGEHLQRQASQLLLDYPAPVRGNTRLWRDESHRLLEQVYPPDRGSLLPIISEAFHQQARAIAQRRLVAAGYRLGWLLEASFRQRVSRETP